MMTKGAKLQEDTFCDTNSRQLDIWSLQSDSDTLAALDITKTSTSQSSLKEVLKKPGGLSPFIVILLCQSEYQEV